MKQFHHLIQSLQIAQWCNSPLHIGNHQKHHHSDSIQKCHELILWIIPQLDKFPRQRRFTLGDKIEQRLLDVLELLIEATYMHRGKARLLEQVNTQLTVLRHLWRLTFELKIIAQKKYIYGGQLLVELGKQIGGWQKQASQ